MKHGNHHAVKYLPNVTMNTVAIKLESIISQLEVSDELRNQGGMQRRSGYSDRTRLII